MLGLKTPDITPAQIVAIVGAIIAVATAFGAPITETQVAAIIGLVTVVSSALLVGDAVIRNGRAKAAAATQQTPNVEIDGIPVDAHEGAEA